MVAVLLVAAIAAVWPGGRDARSAAPRAPGELVVSFLDVGQGDATLLERDGTTVLVDTGPPDGPILQRLEEAGVGRIDVLVLTHAEADHEGAARAVLRAHRVGLVLDGGAGWDTATQRALPAAAARAGARVVAGHAGQRLAAGGIAMRVLWPPAGPVPPEADPNDRALVMHVRVGSFDLLLPADAESPSPRRSTLPAVEALKVAHHGSADEGLPALLARLRPAVAAIEVGRRNTYGHPTATTLAALRVVPNVVRTDRDGTVRPARLGWRHAPREGGPMTRRRSPKSRALALCTLGQRRSNVTTLIVALLVLGPGLLVAEAHLPTYGVLGAAGIGALGAGIVLAVLESGGSLALALALTVPLVVAATALGAVATRKALASAGSAPVRRRGADRPRRRGPPAARPARPGRWSTASCGARGDRGRRRTSRRPPRASRSSSTAWRA